MRAFIFDHAELLAMTDIALDCLIHMLSPDLIRKLNQVIHSDNFKCYKDNENLYTLVESLNLKLEKYLIPEQFMVELKNTVFPDTTESYFTFLSNLNIAQDLNFLFNRNIKQLEEILSVLQKFLNISNHLPINYPPGKREDYNMFCKELKDSVIPKSLSLYVLYNIPYNKNILSEIKHNSSVLYSNNSKPISSGYRNILEKCEIIHIIVEGYKWNIYCKKKRISFNL